MEPRTIARVTALGRLGIGATLMAAPGFVATRWVGADGETTGAQVLATGLGGRDFVLGAGVLAGISRGGARPWLVASTAADLADLVATLRARGRMPMASVVVTTLVAGGAAVAGAWLSAQDDW